MRSTTQRLVSLLLAGSLLAVSSSARADARTEARAHFKRGMAYIGNGKYEEGVSELRLAYEILPHPNVLYNIARAEAEAGELEEAVATYRKYLEGSPADRDEVAQIVAILEARMRRQQAAFAAAQRAELPPPPPTQATPGLTPSAPEPVVTPAAPIAPLVQAPAPEVVPVGRAKTEDVFDETVVTASKGAQSPLDAPNSTSIITEQDIRLSGITKIPELLRRLAGVDVMEPTASQPELSIRGFNQRLSNKVLVLVDGRSVYIDLLGSTFWPSLSIGVEDVERIEVVRGPGSALYGADAFNGVINIITHPPGEGRSGVRAGYGEQGDTHAAAWATGRDGDTAYRLSVGYDYRSVWSRQVASDRPDLHYLTPDDTDAAQRTTRADLRLRRNLGKDVVVGIGGGIAQGPFEFAGYGTLNSLKFAKWQSSDVTAFLRSPHIEARAFWNNFNTGSFGLEAEPIGQSLGVGSANVNVIDGELQYVDRFHTGAALLHDFHLGAGYRFKGVRFTYQDRDRYENHESVYVHDEVKLGERFAVVGDFRLDYVPYLAAVQPSPRGSVIFHPSARSSLRAIAATAFRTPTFLESYFSHAIQLPIAGAAQVNDNARPDLAAKTKAKSENIFTAELGYLNQENDAFTFDSAFFYNRVTNIAQLATNRPLTVNGLAGGLGGLDPSTGLYDVYFGNYDNQCQAYDVLGSEIGARVFPVEGLDLYANYTFMHVRTDASGCSPEQRASLVEDQRTSEHKVNAGVQVRTRAGIDGSIDVHYVSPQTWAEQVVSLQAQGLVYQPFHLDAYTLLNARVGYRFLKNHAEASAAAFNLLGIEHREHPFGQVLGRRAMGFFTYWF